MEDTKLISPMGAIVDVIITVIFCIFMTWVLIPHVPAYTLKVQLIGSLMGSVPMSLMFWIAVSMFRVTVVDMKRRRKEGKDF